MVNRNTATARSAPRKQPRVAEVILFGWLRSENGLLSLSIADEVRTVLDMNVIV